MHWADRDLAVKEQLDKLSKSFDGSAKDISRHLTEVEQKVSARLSDVEQKLARRIFARGGELETKSWGRTLIESEEFKALAASPSQKGKASVEVKTVQTLTSAVGVEGALITPDYRPDPVLLPRRRPSVRSLLAPGQTISNVLLYARQTGRTNAAAVVAETAAKPQSDLLFEQVQAPVTTIATWMLASRQLLDDAPAMMSTVDSELLYMLDYAEEVELLTGDGTGAHLSGLIPNSTAFSAPFTGTGDTNADVLLQALAQSEASLLPATGIILNTIDWLKMLAIKDGMGRYLSNGPFGPAQPRLLWDLNVAPTLAMAAGKFMVGSFAIAAQIFDRMDAEVLASSEDSDNFRKNLITLRAEKRLALAVRRPAALVYGTLPF